MLLLSAVVTSGQSAKVSFLKAVPSTAVFNTKDSVITYPIFSFKNKSLANHVNKILKADFYAQFEKKSSVPIKSVLKILAKEGLAELSYEEILNDNKFFSFVLYHEWIAGYPTYHNAYYAFDKQTGKRLLIDSLIAPGMLRVFEKLVMAMWKDSLVKYRKDLALQLESNEIDSSDYEFALEHSKSDCLESYSPKNFKLNKDTLEIFFSCGFPRVMLPLDPSGSIILPFRTITEYLRPKYRP